MRRPADQKDYPDNGAQAATIYTREDSPEVRVSITYGDSGWECDPGTYLEKPEVALSQLDAAIANLQKIREWLRDELAKEQ